MTSGILYAPDDMMCQALKMGFAQGEVRLYDFPALADWRELPGKVAELGAQFILLDEGGAPGGGPPPPNLWGEGREVPLIFLGEGGDVPKPVNPRELLCLVRERLDL